MSTRRATHANSWYTGNAQRLDKELSGWLSAVEPDGSEYIPPLKGCKAVIAPHAGYSYSGPAAAYAYKSIDTSGIKRVFILGPSHHVYLDGCALSRCRAYETPIGDLPIDRETTEELNKRGQFSWMDISTDEDEHSIEMHLPYIRKIFEGMDIKVVPILVGAIDTEKEAKFGRLLGPYLAQPDTFCVISSDFCHWGTRFRYTYYYPEAPPTNVPAIRLTASSSVSSSLTSHPIHLSIRELDHEGMNALTLTSVQHEIPAMKSSAARAHANFADYLERTHNTICGRHPIGVLMGALAQIEEEQKRLAKLRFVRYEQSSQCISIKDSSVSYASAYVIF